MAVGLHMDHHVPRPITTGLRLRGVDVLAAVEDGSVELEDPDLLDRATSLGRVLSSQDKDLLIEATQHRLTASHSAEWCTPINCRSPSAAASAIWS